MPPLKRLFILSTATIAASGFLSVCVCLSLSQQWLLDKQEVVINRSDNLAMGLSHADIDKLHLFMAQCKCLLDTMVAMFMPLNGSNHAYYSNIILVLEVLQSCPSYPNTFGQRGFIGCSNKRNCSNNPNETFLAIYILIQHKNYVRRSRLKAFTLHTVYDDVPLCAYIEHVRVTHKHMYSAQSQSLRF